METIGADLRQMQRTPLADRHVAALRLAGSIVTYPAGAFMARPGDPADRFTYVVDGEIEVVNPYTNERHLSIGTQKGPPIGVRPWGWTVWAI